MDVNITLKECNRETKNDIYEQIARIEKKEFPKHESLWLSLEREARHVDRKLIYVEINEKVVGYLMYRKRSVRENNTWRLYNTDDVDSGSH